MEELFTKYGILVNITRNENQEREFQLVKKQLQELL